MAAALQARIGRRNTLAFGRICSVFKGGFNHGVVKEAIVEEFVGFLGRVRRLEFEANAIVFVVVVVQVFLGLQELTQLLQDLKQNFIGLNVL